LLVDSHCHLGHIDADPAMTMREARDAGVDAVVDVGMGTAESAVVAARSAELEGVFGCVGVHPNDLEEFAADPAGTMAAIGSLAGGERVVGVGETGLDFYRDRSPRGVQEDAFRAHVALAKELDRALVVHCRDAQQRVLEVLDDAGPPERVVMHCFSGDEAYARACADRGFFCSFAGNVSFKNASALRAAAAALPRRLLLIETDAPFLAPEPFRGRPNAPRLLTHTLGALAGAVGAEVDVLAVDLRDNCARAFSVDLS
jgi:TatD DNase family protein